MHGICHTHNLFFIPILFFYRTGNINLISGNIIFLCPFYRQCFISCNHLANFRNIQFRNRNPAFHVIDKFHLCNLHQWSVFSCSRNFNGYFFDRNLLAEIHGQRSVGIHRNPGALQSCGHLGKTAASPAFTTRYRLFLRCGHHRYFILVLFPVFLTGHQYRSLRNVVLNAFRRFCHGLYGQPFQNRRRFSLICQRKFQSDRIFFRNLLIRRSFQLHLPGILKQILQISSTDFCSAYDLSFFWQAQGFHGR